MGRPETATIASGATDNAPTPADTPSWWPGYPRRPRPLRQGFRRPGPRGGPRPQHDRPDPARPHGHLPRPRRTAVAWLSRPVVARLLKRVGRITRPDRLGGDRLARRVTRSSHRITRPSDTTRPGPDRAARKIIRLRRGNVRPCPNRPSRRIVRPRRERIRPSRNRPRLALARLRDRGAHRGRLDLGRRRQAQPGLAGPRPRPPRPTGRPGAGFGRRLIGLRRG